MTDPRGPAGEDGFEMTFTTGSDAPGARPDPAQDPGPPTAAPARGGVLPGWAVAGIAIGAFAVVLGLVLLLRRPESPPPRGYDDATRAAFVDACAAGGSDTARSVCECTYSTLTQQVPYDRFRELDAAALTRLPTTTGGSTPVQTTGGSLPPSTPAEPAAALPVDVRAIVAACVAAPGGAPGTEPIRGTVPTVPAPASTSTARPS